MDYEKKYKEALERARVIKSKILQSHLSTESCKAVSNYIDEIIPELTESEDERILASIADCVGLMGEDGNVFSNHNVTKACVLAWLEKQQEQTLTDCNELQAPEVDLEKEVEKYFQGLWPGMETAEQCNTDMHFTPPAIMRLVKHFYELKNNAK